MRFSWLSVVFLASPVLAASPASSELEGLSGREAAIVRSALYGLSAADFRGGLGENLLRERVLATPTLEDGERRRIEAHLRGHAPTRIAVGELLQVRQHWHERASASFVFWWHPTHRDAAGFPARGPTEGEQGELEAVLRAAGLRLAVRPPASVPYRIDPGLNLARAHPRTDLRWGISAPNAEAREAVVELIARERGGVPGLWKALGRLLGTCHGDEACRDEAVNAAARSAAEIGLVPVLEALTAGSLGGLDDPAHATSVLFADLVLQERSPEQLGALLDGLAPGFGPEEARRVLWATLGSGPESFDRRLRRKLRAGQAGRLPR